MGKGKGRTKGKSWLSGYFQNQTEIKSDYHYIITKTIGNAETVLNDFPPDKRDMALTRYRWLGQHTKEGEGVITLYRGYCTKGKDRKVDKISVEIDIYDKWLISHGYGKNFETM